MFSNMDFSKQTRGGEGERVGEEVAVSVFL